MLRPLSGENNLEIFEEVEFEVEEVEEAEVASISDVGLNIE